MRLIDSKKSREAINALEARFLEGERLTIEDIIQENFDVKQSQNYFIARQVVRGWMQSLKRKMTTQHDLWFGTLDDSGHYGVANTVGEYRYIMVRYFNHIKGNVRRAVQVRKEAVGKGFMLETREVPIMLPEPPKEDEKK